MRKLIFLLMVASMNVSAQVTPLAGRNVTSYLRDATTDGTTITYTQIFNRTFTGITDTTDWFYVGGHKAVWVNLTSKDTTTILIDYQVTNDPAIFGDATLNDSLSYRNTGTGFKTKDVSSVVGGFNYARFVFRSSATAYALGVTTPTYTASITLKAN